MRPALATVLAFLRTASGERSAPVPWRLAAGVAAAILAIFAAFSLTEAGRNLELKGFDAFTVATAPGASRLPITIVGIDEASLAEIGRQYPWPRSLHAKLIGELRREGALVIAFDVLFSEASTEPEDAALAAAVAEAGNVVMAANMAYQESAYARQWIRMDPIPALRAAGATAGLAAVTQDRDLVVRQLPEGADVFWREIIRRANARSPGLIPEPPERPGAMIRFAGPDHTFPFVSYYQALSPQTHLPPGAFKDQIVLVGRELKASIDAGAAQPDVFATPFTAQTRGLTPGVELHANILESAITGGSIVPAAAHWQLLLLAVATLLSSLLLRRWRPVASFAMAFALCALLVAFSAWLFAARSLWLPFLGAVACVVACYLAYGAIGYLAERRRRAEVKRAFSLYVAPEVVDHMLARPDRLQFGGERRVITVLFTDLAGFTTISEKHGPEEVARVLQQHFTRASGIVKRRRGTLTQFIGDALMAIWGAPLDDPDHAKNACLAAREMQADIELLRGELLAQGLPEIRMRIGVHTCEAIVGNFGAADRFSYTALGDGVNLAARLEGANKLFGTGILVSGATAGALGPDAPLREVSRIVVKGKSEPVDVYTFDEEPNVRELTASAIAAFGRREWDAAEAGFRSILAQRDGEGVARHYVEWIAALRSDPPGADWDRSEALEKL